MRELHKFNGENSSQPTMFDAESRPYNPDPSLDWLFEQIEAKKKAQLASQISSEEVRLPPAVKALDVSLPPGKTVEQLGRRGARILRAYLFAGAILLGGSAYEAHHYRADIRGAERHAIDYGEEKALRLKSISLKQVDNYLSKLNPPAHLDTPGPLLTPGNPIASQEV